MDIAHHTMPSSKQEPSAPESTFPNASTQSLRVLYAEDDPDDAVLCMKQLKQAGIALSADIVASQEAFMEALGARAYDIVLTDYNLPGWSGMEVLRLVQEDGRDIPCILVTGTVGEETAVECIKQGATDYVLKDRPARLPLAVSRALREKSAREERQRAERSRHRLASIVESSDDAIIGAGLDGDIVNWNLGAERVFGYAAEEMEGKPLSSLFAEDTESDAGAMTYAIGGDEAIQRYEAKGTKRNGDVIDLAVTISPIWNSDKTLAGVSAIVRDITIAKRLEQEFLTAQKLEAISQLAGGIAHDFNNLLTVINGYAQILQRKGGSDIGKVEAILQAGERGQKLTKQLLGFSRRQITQFKPLNLNSVVRGMLDMLHPIIGAHIEMRTGLAESVPLARADAGQMEQVIMNLVVNARDAMPSGGILTIGTLALSRQEAENEFGAVTLSVSDTGTGISPEVQARIFEPFFTTKEVGKGTGLGLSTCYGIVQQSKGQIKVLSELGRGTTFVIQLPACATPACEPDEAAIPVQAPAATGSETILLADDDVTVRDFIKSVLEDSGYRLLIAENGLDAISLCTNYTAPIDILVTDVVMPKMNGRELAERARVLRPGLKVLFISGYVDRGLKNEDISNPSFAFLEKPFSGDALLKAVGYALQRSQPVRQLEPA